MKRWLSRALNRSWLIFLCAFFTFFFCSLPLRAEFFGDWASRFLVLPELDSGSYPDVISDWGILYVDENGKPIWLDDDGNTYDLTQGAGSGIPKWGTPTTKTINGGSITVSGEGWYKVDTEGAAASDDLERIQGLETGDEILITAANDNRSIVIKPTGYIKVGSDFTLDNQYDVFEGMCIDGTTGIVIEISRADNGTGAAVPYYILLENDDYLLLENNDKVLLEQ